jgi:hypothetical protein
VLEFLRRQQASMPNLIFDSPRRDPLIDAFDASWQGVVPFTVLLSPEGEVLYQETGSVNALTVRRAILQTLNERKPW